MKVAILTEGGQGIGWGHITRCTSLYQAYIAQDISVDFLVDFRGNGNKFPEYITIMDWQHKAISNYDVVIIDSYLADVSVYDSLKKNNKLLLMIDDFLRLPYPKGCVINGFILAENLSYDQSANEYLLGGRYIPLRDTFWQNYKRNINENVQQVMVTFGGEDHLHITEDVICFLLEKKVEIVAILGPGNTRAEELRNKYQSRVAIKQGISASEMKDLMLNCDLVISAAGQTTYELAATGTPCILIGVADNQEFNLSNWTKTKFIEFPIWRKDHIWLDQVKDQYHKLQNKSERQIRSRIGQECIDGKGAQRIVEYSVTRIRTGL